MDTTTQDVVAALAALIIVVYFVERYFWKRRLAYLEAAERVTKSRGLAATDARAITIAVEQLKTETQRIVREMESLEKAVKDGFETSSGVTQALNKLTVEVNVLNVDLSIKPDGVKIQLP